VNRLGWRVDPGEDVSAVFSGRALDGSEFTIRAMLFDDDEASNDTLEWRAGPLRLDALLVAITNDAEDGRSWLRHMQVAGGLSHDSLDPQQLRRLLNARAEEGLSAAQLNDYALQLGAGGSDGILLRFQQSAAEIDAGVELAVYGKRLRVLAASPEVGAHMITAALRERLNIVLAGASTRFGRTFEAFAGVPFSKMVVETRWTSVEQLRAIVEIGAALRARAMSYAPKP